MASESPRKPALPRARVLIAGDDAARLRRLRHALVRSGRWSVAVAGTFEGVMRELLAREFDLLLVDPELTGDGPLSILGRLRDAGPAAGVPRVALLRVRDASVRLDAWKLGVVDVLEPPLSIDELLVRLSAALSHGRPREAAVQRPGDFSGRLSCVSFAEVISVLAASRRGGTLKVWTGRGRGRVLFHDGTIVHAHFDRKRGHEAIFALMREEHGTFDFRNVALAVERVRRTVTWKATALIIEGARLIDEQRRDLADPTGELSRV
jgi:CheY-like chemotaxis protein